MTPQVALKQDGSLFMVGPPGRCNETRTSAISDCRVVARGVDNGSDILPIGRLFEIIQQPGREVGTGDGCGALFGTPNWPDSLAPQHRIAPSWVREQV